MVYRKSWLVLNEYAKRKKDNKIKFILCLTAERQGLKIRQYFIYQLILNEIYDKTLVTNEYTSAY